LETLEEKHGSYLHIASVVFHIASILCGIVVVLGLCILLFTSHFLVGPVGILIFIAALLQVGFIIFTLETASRLMDFLVDLARVQDDTWRRVEDTRRQVRKS
jgi:hypothetical protein